MNDYVGFIAVAIALLSYCLYIASTLRGKAKPHAISWGIWAVLSGFVFFEQIANQAGPGAWVTGTAAIGNGAIFLLALFRGERSIHRLDWLCLALVGVLLFFWQELTDPTAAIGFAVAIVLLGFIPTIRKIHDHPHGETVIAYFLNGAKFGVALLALNSITWATALYPAAVGFVNLAFAGYLFYRQRKIPIKKRRR